jgi:hypothetical protein
MPNRSKPVLCDLCGKPHSFITNLALCERCKRWVCVDCWCFDLCSECAAIVSPTPLEEVD